MNQSQTDYQQLTLIHWRTYSKTVHYDHNYDQRGDLYVYNIEFIYLYDISLQRYAIRGEQLRIAT